MTRPKIFVRPAKKQQQHCEQRINNSRHTQDRGNKKQYSQFVRRFFSPYYFFLLFVGMCETDGGGGGVVGHCPVQHMMHRPPTRNEKRDKKEEKKEKQQRPARMGSWALFFPLFFLFSNFPSSSSSLLFSSPFANGISRSVRTSHVFSLSLSFFLFSSFFPGDGRGEGERTKRSTRRKSDN